MSQQTSVRAPRLEPMRVRFICAALGRACEQTIALGIPKSLIHGDLNTGNVLQGERCIFIDWSEAYIGCPLVSLQHVLLLARTVEETKREFVQQELITRYCAEWNGLVPLERMHTATRFMPLLAAASALYGRGDWFDSADHRSPSRLAFARTLARHMDRAVTMLEDEVA
jgi:aminoglycoside phosphotransferase (APT) family kinase protein